MRLRRVQAMAGTCLACLAEHLGSTTPDGSCRGDAVNKVPVPVTTAGALAGSAS